MKSRIIFISAIIACITALTGCIKNDIPYPRIQPNITAIAVFGQSQPAVIDTVSRIATVYLAEETDIYNVEVDSCRLSEGAKFVGDSIAGTIDMSSANHYILKLYQEYVWTLKAVQNIERYFTVANQIGVSTIDVPGRRVIVTLPESVNLSKVKVLSAKLGSTNSVITPAIEGETINLRSPYRFEVTDYGRTAEWTVYAEVTESVVTTTAVDAWTNVAWVYGEAREGRNNTVEYRRADSDEWIRVPDEWLTTSGGSFHARLIHLESLTTYVARAVSDNDLGNEIQFTTGANIQPQNADFENWWLDGKIWCPWAEGAEPYWGTGNKGATTLGSSNSVPTDDTPTGTGKAAMLETRFVGIGIIGKLAAGNIFVGSYVKTDGTNGILSFGREFKERPTRLRGYFKYHSAPISSVTQGFENLKDRPDSCIIWCALIDTDEPFEIRTNPKNQHLFDPDGSYVVAYGNMQVGYDVASYKPFDFELEYRSTSRVPKYLLITASASKYGDYFTGGNGSVLCVDDFELLYDY